MNSWVPNCTIETAIAAIKRLGEGVDCGEPYSEFELLETEQRLGRPLPDDLRQFYAEIPRDLFNQLPRASGHLELLALNGLEISPPDWLDKEDLEGDEDPLAPWLSSENITFVNCVCGDAIFYTLSDHPCPAGTVLLSDHESDLSIQVMGETLADWLLRLTIFEGLEPAYFGGYLKEFPPDDRLTFLREHQRLNPTDGQNAIQLYREEHPDDGRFVYWDRERAVAGPLEELTWIKQVQIFDLNDHPLKMFRNLKSLEELNLAICDDRALDDLAGLTSLRELNLSDWSGNDLQPLAGLASLQELGFYHGSPIKIMPLASLKNLRKITVLHKTVPDGDEFRAARPDVELVLQRPRHPERDARLEELGRMFPELDD